MQLLDVTELANVINLRPHNIYNLAKRGMPHYRHECDLLSLKCWIGCDGRPRTRGTPMWDEAMTKTIKIYTQDPQDTHGFEPIGSIMPTVMKEISRRVELRARLEAEHGGPIDDRTFLAIAEREGIRL